jgi:hypothetical protein
MKYLIYNCIFILIIIIFAYVNTIYEQKIVVDKTQKEAFTPKMRELYRPYVRNARIMSEGFYDAHSSNMSNLFRKFGIL